ncbi:immune-related, lectin-like receptor 4 [Astyanax mexicanus]|uniref:immune-related, lectin-like receptor 4 n=1 Tax=Astyanax mexicanus TaxID=7994 RepID=UPI0020CB35DE|nr:immune-related, lectin-like receptor 4 [Astyanax mexicanus]
MYSKSHAGSCLHCACPAFVALCLILLGAVAVLTVLYISHDLKLKERLELQDQLSKNQTEHGQHDLSRNSADSRRNCFQRELSCPKKWEYHGGKCYFFSENRLNWTRSRDHCISIGGHLAIKSIEEQEFMGRLVQSKMMTDNDRFWIGLTDEQVETQWLWVDNTPLDEMIRHWLEKEPDNWTVILINPTGEDCASMGKGYPTDSDNWHDENCATLHKSVCESISPNNG